MARLAAWRSCRFLWGAEGKPKVSYPDRTHVPRGLFLGFPKGGCFGQLHLPRNGYSKQLAASQQGMREGPKKTTPVVVDQSLGSFNHSAPGSGNGLPVLRGCQAMPRPVASRNRRIHHSPTNTAPDRGSLQEENDLPGTLTGAFEPKILPHRKEAVESTQSVQRQSEGSFRCCLAIRPEGAVVGCGFLTRNIWDAAVHHRNNPPSTWSQKPKPMYCVEWVSSVDSGCKFCSFA